MTNVTKVATKWGPATITWPDGMPPESRAEILRSIALMEEKQVRFKPHNPPATGIEKTNLEDI